jgi:hypothetical protein
VIVAAREHDAHAVGSLEDRPQSPRDAPDAPGDARALGARAGRDQRVVRAALERETERWAANEPGHGEKLASECRGVRWLFDDDSYAAQFGKVTDVAAEPVGDVDERPRRAMSKWVGETGVER